MELILRSSSEARKAPTIVDAWSKEVRVGPAFLRLGFYLLLDSMFICQSIGM
jgi:hypothetical protein